MKKIKLPAIVIVSTFIGFFSAVSLSQIEIKPIKLEVSESVETKKDLLKDVFKTIKKDYVDEKSDSELEEAAASGVMSSLDPHSSYLSPESFKEMQVQTKGEFGGVGIEITSDLSVIKVVAAIEGTPADRVGIKSGDYIVKVEDKSIYGLDLSEVVKKLRGKPGTKVKVTILRKGEKTPLEKIIKREIIKVRAVRSEAINDVAYVKINTFSGQAYKGLIEHVNGLRRKIGEDNLKGLVLDLRGNPGGLLDQAIRVSDAFLDKGKVIVSIKGRSTKEKIYQDDANESLVPNLPVVVLINEGSASASEIVSGALQDNKRAVIMGNKSFGKGSVQTVIPLSKERGALRLTTSLYYTPSGKSIQAHGIEPDIELANATIEEQKTYQSSEADLNGHIEVRIKEYADNKDKISDDNLELYQKDYQLARAVDLVRGVSVYNSTLGK
ncbi:MAG: S41 family peptidase [Rickettsiales bacterium]|nr:S41 family peptidase [Rickettsiales bacterium]